MLVGPCVQLEVRLEVGVVRAQVTVVDAVLECDVAGTRPPSVHLQMLYDLAKGVSRERPAYQALQWTVGVHVRWLEWVWRY